MSAVSVEHNDQIVRSEYDIADNHIAVCYRCGNEGSADNPIRLRSGRYECMECCIANGWEKKPIEYVLLPDTLRLCNRCQRMKPAAKFVTEICHDCHFEPVRKKNLAEYRRKNKK